MDTTDTIVEHIRARGMDAWSEQFADGMPDAHRLDWADAVVIVDPTPKATYARTPFAWQRHPRILITSGWLTSAERAELLDDGFDHVLTADCSPLVIAAIAERLVHRGAFPLALVRDRDASREV